jgi:hypothetical protein
MTTQETYIHTQTNLVKIIAEIATAIPLMRTIQLYEFALFLKSRSLSAEETNAEVAADEALWDAQFTATDNHKLADLVAQVESEINSGTTLPMFDERGTFIEHT